MTLPSLLAYAHLVLNPVYMLILGGTALAAAAMICLFEGKRFKRNPKKQRKSVKRKRGKRK